MAIGFILIYLTDSETDLPRPVLVVDGLVSDQKWLRSPHLMNSFAMGIMWQEQLAC